ncbi:hypothetical protein A3C67_00085 [Candidatus Nomurabacteria bacterium RIFCSPHIGHO2_02_FULL_42_19]|uniref:Uncharacterized protein n=1 Tax=Candidatus Nomurabacteria bacterium RIFCSPHIGHO2_02_FULL_42_19 TaxID=1801756 RepID=A0A1F6W3M0_9BACT|nr:MAG: hypothetical protein A3C67_00085 [Candidatus Nomurabacteria bacterium RIFCSPHIGHO2_02_FULL_42_19]
MPTTTSAPQNKIGDTRYNDSPVNRPAKMPVIKNHMLSFADQTQVSTPAQASTIQNSRNSSAMGVANNRRAATMMRIPDSTRIMGHLGRKEESERAFRSILAH